ncbi:MAG: ABC transporter ATP-binding protein [Alphaproteobacteria bacterium]|nr:ABC transporter ATP-binding protein [Alphaproteobacteria bacterium]
MTAPLEARAIRVERGGRPVLDRVDFALRTGECVGLIGPNGAGKTTLLRALLGLQPVSAGRVLLEDRPIEAWEPSARARRLAYLPQQGGQAWPVRVERFVSLGRLPHLEPWRGPGPTDREAVSRAMAAADVTALADRPVTALSGGEQARVHLARALAVEAPLLLADEPTAGLDPYHQLQLMARLRALARRDGRAVVVVLHDLTAASRFCDRLCLLNAGAVAADGPPRTVLTPERLAAVYGVTPAPHPLPESAVLPWRCIDETRRDDDAA